MTRREYCLHQADLEIRRLIRAECDATWLNLPEYIKEQGHGVITEPYLRERLADQVELILDKEEERVTWLKTAEGA